MYKPIDGQLGEIRVITVYPGQRDDPIRCSLRTCSLLGRTKPSYRALSYAWGKEMADEPITVDGHVRFITSSLYSALRSLREQDDAITLWADALCINQEDLVEKMHQIGQMKEIYQQAQRVVVWLGEHKEAEQFVAALREETGERILIPDPSIDAHRQAIFNLDHFDHYDLYPMRDLLDRDWWRRIWVVQEVVAATKEPVVRFGNIDFPWRDWAELASLAENKQYGDHNARFCSAVSRLRRGALLEYEDVCILVREMQASEPRDKIFAVLAFVNCKLAEPMQADYSLPVSTIYCKFTMTQICYRNNLGALRVRQSGEEFQDSSWALGPCGVEPSVLYYSWVSALYYNLNRFTAITELKPRVRWSEDCTILFAKGVVADNIEISLLTLFDKTYECPGRPPDVLLSKTPKWRRLLAGIPRLKIPKSTRNAMKAFVSFVEFVQYFFYTDQLFDLGHCFYRTRTGKHVFGDPDFHPGDKICLLYGGRTDAFVLRDYGDYHRLVGCAYVEGMEHPRFHKRLYEEKDIVEFEIR
jgi:hypothetical protein